VIFYWILKTLTIDYSVGVEGVMICRYCDVHICRTH